MAILGWKPRVESSWHLSANQFDWSFYDFMIYDFYNTVDYVGTWSFIVIILCDSICASLKSNLSKYQLITQLKIKIKINLNQIKFTDFNIIKSPSLYLFPPYFLLTHFMKLLISSHSNFNSQDLFSQHSGTPSKANSRSKSKGKKSLEVTCNKRASPKPKI